MKTLNYLRFFFAVNLIAVIVYGVFIRGYFEIARQKKVTQKDVAEYIKNTEILKIPNFKKIQTSFNREEYFDGTPFVKKGGFKRIGFVYGDDNKVYKIELFHPQSTLILNNKTLTTLYLSVNKSETNRKGTKEDPIIALRYFFGNDENNYVPQKEYEYNVKEYLTYKNYTPPNSKSISYYLVMIWVFLTIAGFSITTGVLIKKGYINKEGKFNPQGKDIDK